MKSQPVASLSYQELPSGRKLLVGHVRGEIPAGALLSLTRDDGADTYSLHCATPDGKNRNCPSNLASFLAPHDQDQNERHHAAALAAQSTTPKRRKTRD